MWTIFYKPDVIGQTGQLRTFLQLCGAAVAEKPQSWKLSR